MKFIMVAVGLLAVAASAYGAAPEWFRKAEVYNGWYKAWDEKVIGEKMKGIPFVVGAPPDKKLVEAAHKQGTKVITYITLYQMPLDEVYQGSKLVDHPDWIVINAQGERARSVFWGTENIGWYEVCANNASYRKAALAYIRKVLASGVDGLFIDNAAPPAQCYGEKFGKLQDVYLDVETDEPQFATIKEGFIGRHLTFVPLGGVKVGPDSLEAAVSKEQVQDAPNIEQHGEELSQADVRAPARPGPRSARDRGHPFRLPQRFYS